MSTGRRRWTWSLFSAAALTVFQFPELSVAAYNKNGTAINEPAGIVAVWNLHLVDRPEFVFYSQVSLTLEDLQIGRAHVWTPVT